MSIGGLMLLFLYSSRTPSHAGAAAPRDQVKPPASRIGKPTGLLIGSRGDSKAIDSDRSDQIVDSDARGVGKRDGWQLSSRKSRAKLRWAAGTERERRDGE